MSNRRSREWLRSLKGKLDAATGLVGRGGRQAKDVALQGATGARAAVSRGREGLETLWEPEDPAELLHTSPLLRPLPPAASQADPRLASLRWRNDALLAFSAAGLLTFEREIIAVTDGLFHKGLPTPELSERIFGQDLSELHRWIDTVPGSTVAGGGITHRVAHGHDLAAAGELYEQHGIIGPLAWAQHVDQDFFSITGIPIPVGAENIASWLVEQGYASKGNAALLVSFNTVELAASFLAGAFALRLAFLVHELQSRRKVKKRCAAALAARERGDVDAVIASYSEALSLSGGDAAIALALGWAYREAGRPMAESFLAFRDAAMRLAMRDRTLDVGGLSLSLRGLAYLLALGEVNQILEQDDLRGAWRSELDRMVRGAVSSFETTAISQLERPRMRLGEREIAWRVRPLSAAANYYLAARSVAATSFLTPSADAGRLRDRAVAALREAARGEDALIEAASGTERRWRLELAA